MIDQRILVVDDDKKTVDLIRLYLEREGYQVLVAYDGKQALDLARRMTPDLIVLDLMLPEIDGLDVCRMIRAKSSIPIIMLTARTTEDDKLRGLNLGADDYIIKPFSPLELMARLRAVLRRTGTVEVKAADEIRVGELVVNVLRHEVRVGTRSVLLTPKEFKILEVLSRDPGRVFSRSDLLIEAFGYNYEGLERTVDVHVMNLRRKIEEEVANPVYIQTVYGVGYKLDDRTHAS